MVPPVVMLPRFQSTRPSGVRQSFHIPLWAAASFQSTHPSGVRRPTACNACTTAKYFNPRTPVGCDTGGPQARRPDADFNPRTPVGCDRSGLRGRGGFVEISIHAPQWGATTVDATITPILRFQSTHPSGVRPTATRTAIRVCNFNPRTPVGCDAREVAGAVHELISIHAPQWGATCRSFPRSRRQSISIHAPQWGATCGRFSTRFTVVFQSTHPSGVRHSLCHPVLPLLGISIHAPQWGATDAARGRRTTCVSASCRCRKTVLLADHPLMSCLKRVLFLFGTPTVEYATALSPRWPEKVDCDLLPRRPCSCDHCKSPPPTRLDYRNQPSLHGVRLLPLKLKDSHFVPTTSHQLLNDRPSLNDQDSGFFVEKHLSICPDHGPGQPAIHHQDDRNSVQSLQLDSQS